jgi:hypothetical protein
MSRIFPKHRGLCHSRDIQSLYYFDVPVASTPQVLPAKQLIGVWGKLGSMLGNDEDGQKDVNMEEDIGVQLGQLRITDGRE